MVYLGYMTPFLLATSVLADYDVDNSNKSMVYTFPPGGLGWITYSVATGQLELQSGNSTVVLDASNCYDQNYAQGCCRTSDNCQAQIPFTGSGITMYMFNAGTVGMAASFSIDGGKAVSITIQPPPPPSYQVSNVSMYDIQGLASGNHVMAMTLLDWNGTTTCVNFDYAHVNETLVEIPATTSAASSQTLTSTSQTPSQTPTQSSSQISTGNSSAQINLGGVLGGTLGGTALLTGLLIGFFCLRKRHKVAIPAQDPSSRVSAFQINPFISEHPSSATQRKQTSPGVSPFARSAILRDAIAVGHYPSSESAQSINSRSGMSSSTPVLQLPNWEIGPGGSEVNDLSRLPVADGASPFVDPTPSRINLTTEQLDVIARLRADNLPAETISRVIEGFIFSYPPADENMADMSVVGTSVLPPSYQTRDR